jgi:poly(A) polymerase
LGRETKDHDIATSASPDALCELFPRAITVGKAFGVIKVPIEGIPEPLEIATFREDLEYKDHRHPEGVKFSGPLEDARRRDFSINALFYDPKTSRILDPTNGYEDLKAGCVRAIGDPVARFKEDALRLLRAVRFTTTLGFSLEPETRKAVHDKAKLIAHVSQERIRDEITLMLKGSRPANALELMSSLGLLAVVLPEVEALKRVSQAPTYLNVLGARGASQEAETADSVWATTLKTVRELAEKIPKRSNALAWGAVLYDIGKPVASARNEGKNFNGHEIDGARIARTIGERLKMPRAEVDQIVGLVEDLHKFRGVFRMREATLERFVRQPGFAELLELHRAQSIASDGNLAFYEFCLSRHQDALRSDAALNPKLIDGKDLIQLGFKPGPEFSNILRTVEDMALEKKLLSKEQALEFVISHFVK